MPTGPQRIEAALHRLASPEHQDAAVVASACDVWRRMGRELAPIIGGAGVRALLRRSVLLAQARFDWLKTDLDRTPGPDPIDQLCHGLGKRARAEAVDTNILLVQTFYRLLAGLIGDSLADRLLAPVFFSPSAGSSEQDPCHDDE